MARIIKCNQCGKTRPHKGHGLCHTCFNQPYILAFRLKNPTKNIEYQETHRIKKILSEQEKPQY